MMMRQENTYCPVGAQQQEQSHPLISRKMLYNAIILTMLCGALAITYNRCVTCVVCIALFALLTISCVPGMGLVFVLSVMIIVGHSVNYNKATVDISIPLSDIVHIPSWTDLKKDLDYVHVEPAVGRGVSQQQPLLPIPPPQQQQQQTLQIVRDGG